MIRRGRPPHPDILTPREWEVLALLREELTDQAIADRLGISLDGAKYHVREILSKLGVASRQEAAAWEPEERARARRWLAVPLALRVAGALVVVAAVGGLGLLAWGVVRTNDEAGGQDALDLPTPGSPPQTDADSALLQASERISGDIREVQGALTTWGAAKEASRDTSSGTFDLPDDWPTWIFRFRGMFVPSDAGGSVGPANPNATPGKPTPTCSEITVRFPDVATERGPLEAVTISGTEGDCSRSVPLSRELAIVLAIRATLVFWPQDEPPILETEQVSLRDAQNTVANRGNRQFPEIVAKPGDTPVWLVTFAGRFFEPEGIAPDGGTPRPTTVLSCADRFVILDVASHEVIYKTQAQYDACD